MNLAKRLIETGAIISGLYHITEFLIGKEHKWLRVTALLTVLVIAAIVSLDRESFLRRFPKGLWRWLIPPSRRDHVKKLKQKYPNTEFFIAPDEPSFNRMIYKTLKEAVDQKRLAKESEGPVGKVRVQVGIVCGPMVLKMAQHVANSATDGRRYPEVRFVAMNRAAESDSFQYSANYLATLLSAAFPDSKPTAYTFNDYDKPVIDNARRNVDILLCSAGPYSVPELERGEPEQGYLPRWWNRATAQQGSTDRLPSDCIGDCCLIPIDLQGWRLLR